MINKENKTWLDLITTCIKAVATFVVVCLVLFIVFDVGKAQAKAAPTDGICETIIIEKGGVISKEEYPCENDS